MRLFCPQFSFEPNRRFVWLSGESTKLGVTPPPEEPEAPESAETVVESPDSDTGSIEKKGDTAVKKSKEAVEKVEDTPAHTEPETAAKHPDKNAPASAESPKQAEAAKSYVDLVREITKAGQGKLLEEKAGEFKTNMVLELQKSRLDADQVKGLIAPFLKGEQAGEQLAAAIKEVTGNDASAEAVKFIQGHEAAVLDVAKGLVQPKDKWEAFASAIGLAMTKIGELVEKLMGHLEKYFDKLGGGKPAPAPENGPEDAEATPEKPEMDHPLGKAYDIKKFFTDEDPGMDFDCPIGTSIFAVDDAEVVATENAFPSRGDEMSNPGIQAAERGPGNLITLKLKNGNYVRYSNLSVVSVAPGTEVKKGQELGATGNSGEKDSTNLHFEYFSAYQADMKEADDHLNPEVIVAPHYNPPPAERSLDRLTPAMKARVDAFLVQCKKQGLDIVIVETVRSEERQNALYRKGRTAPGHIVTNARAGEKANHTHGNAIDVNFRNKTDATAENWNRLGELGKQSGLFWGGNWESLKDHPHFEFDKKWKAPAAATA